MKLTEAQRRALAAIAGGRPVAGNDEGWVFPNGSRPTVAALESMRAIERRGYDDQGVMCGSGLLRITDLGRRALAESEGGER